MAVRHLCNTSVSRNPQIRTRRRIQRRMGALPFHNGCDRQAQKEGYTILSVEQAEDSISLDKFIPEKGKKYALVFGNEVEGVQQEVVSSSDGVLEIPQYGTKHSLNISVTAGIVLWHFRLTAGM